MTNMLGFEDPVSSWSHLLGALVMLIFVGFLFRENRAGRKQTTAVLIFGFACVFLLSMSGVYHLLPRDTTSRYVLRILDHAGILTLIAGTIIAVHIVLFSGLMRWGVIIFASVLATVGITLGSIFFDELPAYMSLVVYLSFGWLGVVSVIGIWRLEKTISIRYLVFGGLAYTLGAILDGINFPLLIPHYFGPHEVFHFAVLLGIGFHWQFLIKAIHRVEQHEV